MIQMQNKFFSCVESRIQDQGELYARFHLGTFFRGQALTVANALRRTLLAEIPSMVVTEVHIEGVVHEFATIPGIQESVLDILLNLKRLVFTLSDQESSFITQQATKNKVFLKIRGPAEVTAGALKLPPHLACVWPDHHIATLSSDGELTLSLGLEIVNPNEINLFRPKNSTPTINEKKIFQLDTIPSPVRKVNYVIHELDAKTGSEYVALEIWTDGSLKPNQALQFSLKQLTKLFYEFAQVSKNLLEDHKEIQNQR